MAEIIHAQSMPLFTLPAELRTRIYEEVLTSFEPISLTDWGSGSPIWSPPPLLHTCRKIRMEASEIYYGNNTFGLTGPQANRDWISAIAGKQQAMLRRLHLWGHIRPVTPDKAAAILTKLLGEWTERGFAVERDAVYIRMKLYTLIRRGQGWKNLEEVERVIMECDGR